MPDRRYSDEEFALIFQRASELQDRADGAEPNCGTEPKVGRQLKRSPNT